MKKALEELSLEANIEKITGMAALTERGVSAPPAIAVDGKILTQGSIPGVEQVKLLLRQLSADLMNLPPPARRSPRVAAG